MNTEEIKRLCPDFAWVFDRFGTIHKTNAVEILQALAEARKALEWQPIATLPKHKKTLLFYKEEVFSISCRGEDGCQAGRHNLSTVGIGSLMSSKPGFARVGKDAKGEWIVVKPTHWMPLPHPPQVGEG